MSEVSLEAELGKTSAEDPHMDDEEADKAEESLSEDLDQESVDDSGDIDDTAYVLYDIDIHGDGEKTETSDKASDEDVQEGFERANVVSSSVDDGGRETAHHVETTEPPEEIGKSQPEQKVMFTFTLNNQPALDLPRLYSRSCCCLSPDLLWC